ncbi:MAG: cell division protein FtsZ [Selenomonadaceae bacterium]|nr:cell division protein FtsZ [Selenomonadaceae bacterium]
MVFEDLDLQREIVKMKVFGVGGGGNSVLVRMSEKDIGDVELVAVNTDEKQLARAKQAGVTPLLIGQALTKGRGTGGSVEVGEAAANMDERKIREMMLDANLIFLTAGMGGGVGTGATPVVAKIAKDMGILTIGVVTVPFSFEGARKQRIAMEGIKKMQADMDALLVVHNDNLMKIADKKLSLVNAFKSADDVLRQAIRSIAELILTTGIVNVDFADVETIFTQSESSDALLGIGKSNNSAVEAVKSAVTSPLIDKTLTGARGLILNITASNALTLYDVNEATEFIYKNADETVNIIFGVVIDNEMGSTIQATIIATDFAGSSALKAVREEKNKNDNDNTTPKVSFTPASLSQEPADIAFDLPKFMQKSANKSASSNNSGNAFALPAFKLTDGK